MVRGMRAGVGRMVADMHSLPMRHMHMADGRLRVAVPCSRRALGRQVQVQLCMRVRRMRVPRASCMVVARVRMYARCW